jgi:hypothetical protein
MKTFSTGRAMRPTNVAIALITLTTSAHADEPKAVQIDTAPIEEPPLPRPRPLLHDVIADNPAVLISAFRYQNGEGPVAISSALVRIAQEQADVMAVARSQCAGSVFKSDR